MAWITPVTDRTLNDVLDAKRNQTGMLGKKGAMDYPDLNRIEDNYKYLMGLMNGAGYYNQFESRNVTETWKEPEVRIEMVQDKNTMLLLHCDDFTDSSIYGKEISNTGCTISSDAKFDRSINFTNLNKIETKDQIVDINKTFTIEFWCKQRQKKSYATFIGGTVANTFKITLRGGEIGFQIHGNSEIYITGFSPIIGEWFHVALVGNNRQFTFFINGEKKNTFTINNTITNSVIRIGLNVNQDDSGSIEGVIDELRISDIIRYTDNFILQINPFIVEETITETIVVEKSQTFTDWQKDNIFFKPEADRIRRNLNKLSQIYLKGLGLPELDFLDSLNYIEANQWENIELETYKAYSRMIDGYKYCGTQISGGVTL